MSARSSGREILRVAVAQLDLTVGDFDGNSAQIREAMRRAEEAHADVLLTPELSLPGYPPEDLLLRDEFIVAQDAALRVLAAESATTLTIVGAASRTVRCRAIVDAVPRCLANAAVLLHRGEIVGEYAKCLLPDYGVFDEGRYFDPGDAPATVWALGDASIGISVCEDLWRPGVPDAQATAGADILLGIHASPFHMEKAALREAAMRAISERTGLPVVYCNLVGAQDELVFDGRSFVVTPEGVLWRGAEFGADFACIDVPLGARVGTADIETSPTSTPIQVAERRHAVTAQAARPDSSPWSDGDAELWSALVLGLRAYVDKNGFPRVFIGLSGGIDSAVVAALAVDALGSQRVVGVGMPSAFSSQGALDDASELATRLAIRFEVLPIHGPNAAVLSVLRGDSKQPSAHSGPFADTEVNVAEENIQARIRGLYLMALSNKEGGIVVTTGNKSELAVGYSTLYGDMAGGFAAIGDVPKTRVYSLARWRNRVAVGGLAAPIPDASITKPPSAELRADQLDSDSLPPYALLDRILELYVDADRGIEAILSTLAADGETAADIAATVTRIVQLVDRSEHKRRQYPPCTRVTRKAFGRDRRLPITNAFRR